MIGGNEKAVLVACGDGKDAGRDEDRGGLVSVGTISQLAVAIGSHGPERGVGLDEETMHFAG